MSGMLWFSASSQVPIPALYNLRFSPKVPGGKVKDAVVGHLALRYP